MHIQTKLLLSILSLTVCVGAAQAVDKYEATQESIMQHEIPDWALDAKFGIYAHWGPYSEIGVWEENQTYPDVGNYYIVGYRGMYDESPDEPRRKAFEAHYGPMSEGHGYLDLCRDFKVEKFDPASWADLVAESGAKYAGMAVVHHDGYLLWDSEVTPYCAGKLGAKRDIVGELFTEFEKRDIKTLATFHHARTKGFWNGYYNRCKKFDSLHGADLTLPENQKYLWWLGQDTFAERRLAITTEFINKYQPDTLWFDGGGAKDTPWEILSTYFNMGLEANKGVVVHNKWAQFGEGLGIYGYERGRDRPEDLAWPFEDDITSSIGPNWSWWHGIRYKTPEHIIRRLTHVTAQGGGLLLSLNVRPDGSFDPELVAQLKGTGAWLKQNGEAIHGTRPWKIHGEGHMTNKENFTYWTKQRWDIGHPVEKSKSMGPNVDKFDHTDIRFTTGSSDTLYAIQMKIPDYHGKTYIKTLRNETQVGSKNTIKSIELLGHGPVKFERSDEELTIWHPAKLPNQVALAFKITVDGELERQLPTGR
ncbi:hypothetical protein SCARR_00615 [Pontiella sulfatireligans]|uniref:alpha-L-fucosidase n=2 Tax=Pontiella sulfatireligans TaxID=2750658 RepID=A0A6C2UEB8_9BACT|nr:hypothetical protein SCARR_00615 [Pontiella sulfatireligans]